MSFIKLLVKVLKFFGIMILIELVIFAVFVIISMVFDCCGREDMSEAVLDIWFGVACLSIVVVVVFAELKKKFGTNQTSETNPTIRILKKTLVVLLLLGVGGFFLFCCDAKILKIVGVIIAGPPALYLLFLYLTRPDQTSGTNKSSRTSQTSETNQTPKTSIRYYCKWCGRSCSSIQGLTNGLCNWNPNSKYHELYEGDEKARYECKWCGRSYSSIQSLTNGLCNKNPQSKYHEPAL